ncbi:MAG TPA: hypothetical protein VIG74_01445, partial [Alphaproteobacteria bacterium]
MTGTFLNQWANMSSPAAQGPAKQHEFSVYVPPLIDLLVNTESRKIVDFQADEGVNAVAFCVLSPQHSATFVLIPPDGDPGGAMADMTRDITADMRSEGQLTLAASLDEIEAASADAILFNNILGCQGCVENIEPILDGAARVVKPGGYAIVTVPNPDGGAFSSYSCSNLPSDRAHGGTYDFQMKGEKDVFVNL